MTWKLGAPGASVSGVARFTNLTGTDVTFSEKTINSPSFTELRRKKRQQKNEEFKKNPKTSKRKVKSAGFLSPKKEEFFLYQLRVQIDGFSRYREDVIVFGDEKKEKKSYDATHINNNETNIKIDKKRKLASINDKYKWGAEAGVIYYGTFLGHHEIARSIIRFCRKNAPDAGTVDRELRNKGIVKISGKDAVIIELFDLKNKHSIYEMFLDTNDWGQCYKIVWYNEDGTCEERISEFSKFLKDKKSGILYPHVIVQKYFYDECKEKKRNIIRIKEVSLGLPISDDVFEINVSDDYRIIDHRMNPLLRISPKTKDGTEKDIKAEPKGEAGNKTKP